MGGLMFLILILVLIVIVVASCIKVVPQARAYVIERLGLYQGTWEPAGSGFPAAAGNHKR